ncbi:MAG TPA: PepSY domain-containing protein [Candidatus Kapabacteria bacterium]|nr:PepSY domain-containing protein [Candidatus Kapabacteria bacterium]
MKGKLLALGIFSILMTGVAQADDHCDDPVADWQPRDALRHELESNGWQVKRIRVDDGCYEVDGIDSNGNRFEATFTPASLEIRELEIRFRKGGRAGDYLDKDRPHHRHGAPAGTPASP